MMWLRKFLAFFAGHPCPEQDWYQMLSACFQPPHAHLRWTLKNNRPEMQWQRGDLSLFPGTNSSRSYRFSAQERCQTARRLGTLSG